MNLARLRLAASFSDDADDGWADLATIADSAVSARLQGHRTVLTVLPRGYSVALAHESATDAQKRLNDRFITSRQKQQVSLAAALAAHFQQQAIYADHRLQSGEVHLADDTTDLDAWIERVRQSGLLKVDDADKLAALLQAHGEAMIAAGWALADDVLAGNVSYPGNDLPTVAEISAAIRSRAVGIDGATQRALADALSTGVDRGYSIDQIARGVTADDFAGVRSIVAETYRNRSRAIATYETGWAQNHGAIARYREAGLTQVLIFDDEMDTSCKICIDADGDAWDLDDFNDNPIEHPYCPRVGTPLPDDMESNQEEET